MKRKLSALFATIIVTLTFFGSIPAFADSPQTYVFDEANLLTENQLNSLEKKAAEVSEKYQCGLYIVTVDDFTDYTTSTDAFYGAKQLYLDKQLGLGDDQSGQILLLSMKDRDYALIAHGYGTIAFTKYGNAYITKKFLDDFKKNNWYSGFNDYLDTSARLLKSAANGKPFDKNSPTPLSFGFGILICVSISVLIGWLVLHSFKSSLKSVYAGDSAIDYLPKNGVDMRVCTDHYTHKSQSRVRIESSNSSSHSSHSSHSSFSSSGGFTGSRGKF